MLEPLARTSVAVIVTCFVSPGRTSPNDSVGGSNVNCGFASRAALTRPAPRCFASAGMFPSRSSDISVSAVLSSALFTCAGVHAGWSDFVSAARAVMCGVAIDVPLSWSKSPAGATAPVASFPTHERMLEPGAAMSGLIAIVSAGPRLLEPATTSGQPDVRRWSGPSMLTVGVAFAVAHATRARPSASVTMTHGRTGATRAPIAIGASGPLLCTIIARAPPAITLFFFTSNVQVPRPTRAILPVRDPAANGVQASPAFPLTPPGATTYSPEIVEGIGGAGAAPGTPGRPVSVAGGVPGPVTVTALENTRACELFATVMTFGLIFQEPVMLLSPFAPALPDEAATIVPASTAASSAARIGSWAGLVVSQRLWPRLMLSASA